MKLTSFALITTTFLCSVFAQDAPFDTAQDHYDLKTVVTESDHYGFTIEYHKYYKVVTNLQSSRKYCLVGFNQSIPDECNSLYTFNTPITQFSVDNGYDTVMPFIELLGIQNLVIKTNTSQVTSPCFADSISDTTAITPSMTISDKTSGGNYIDFSANNDNLTPLQKAAWLMYLGAFFDLEDISVAVYTQLSNNYACHKNNVAAVSKATQVGWTSYDAAKKLYTLHSEPYYADLIRDAGGSLVATNPAQPDVFDMTTTMDQTLLANALHGASYVIDTSATTLDYDTYISGNGFYFRPNAINNVTVIISNKVYTTNGLLNSNNVSDWSQRGVARPDLALLEIIKFLYPDFQTANNNLFPIWLRPFNDPTDRHYMTQDIYGGCSNISYVAFEQSQCTFGSGGGATNAVLSKKLSSGDKAGISVGTVIFVIIALVVGIWGFRKYQKRKRRHNFYRMNDL